MNIVSKVTVKHLKENRKRTIVTILGIMLSVALITAISAFAESFLDMMRQSVIAEGGEWHVRFEEVRKDQLSSITEDDRVKETLLSKTVGSALLSGCKNEYKPYLLVKAYDEMAMKEYPTTLVEGRYPENSGEIVLPEHLKTDGGIGWKVGDTIELEVGKRFSHGEDGDYEIPENYGLDERETLENTHLETYTVVGIIERPNFESYGQAGYTAITYLDADDLRETDTLNAAVQLIHLDNSLYEWGDSLAEDLGVTDCFNNSLLSYYLLSGNGTIVSMLDMVKWVMMLIVAAGSVAVIYSSFSISISERGRYLGMLASVGATKKQKRSSVFTEAAILGGIGIPLGLLLGFAGVFVTTRCIRTLVASLFGMEGVTMRVIISWQGVLGAVILAVITIIVSAWIPAWRASRITPVEAIRQNKDIKLSARQVKTSWLTKKLFGFEGELALKNLKRNKKRYRATILSLVFCIALYLSVASFTDYLKGAYAMEMGIDSVSMPDISISLYSSSMPMGESGEVSADEAASEELKKLESCENKIRSLDHIMEYTSVLNDGFSYYLDDGEMLSDAARAEQDEWEETEIGGQNMGRYRLWVQVYGMDEESLKAYAEKTGADESLLYDGEKTGVILVNRGLVTENGKKSWEKVVNVKTGDVLTGSYAKLVNDSSDNYKETVDRMELTVAGVTEELPLGGGYYDNINSISVYTTVENAVEIMSALRGENIPMTADMEISLRTDDNDSLMADLKEIENDINMGMYAYSLVDELKMINNMLLLINVFVYGFIILTALICITSIFNTISTSMALRRREYAMLQSVGMDPKRFGRMIAYESVFYGLKALLYGLPFGLILMYCIYLSIASAIDTGFYIIWKQGIIAIVCVMAVVGLTMWYSARKIKKANIVDVLKNENI